MIKCNLGAIDCQTNKYTYPSDANKSSKYICIACNEFVFPKIGNIREPHFCHYANTNCKYFEHASESEIHKLAKYRLVEWINNGLSYAPLR
jgi:competence protein CoiA